MMMRLFTSAAFVAASLIGVRVEAEETEVSFAYVPAPDAEAVVIDQPMGRLTVTGWDKPEVRIVARKRAPNNATLDRLRVNVEMRDGRIRIRTGVRVGDGFRALPQGAEASTTAAPAMAIDLTVDAPRRVQVTASTWAGDLEASGFRAGAVLTSAGGEVRARDIEGHVRTNALKGRQRLSSIRGDVEADGVTGDLELDTVDGDTLEAKVVEGQITARDVRTPVVRLLSTSGGIVLVGSLRPGGRYELTSLDGDIHLQLKRAPLSLRATASALVRSAFPVVPRTPSDATTTRLVGDFLGGGPSLELTAAHGSVLLDRY
jgi:hypothetical protein